MSNDTYINHMTKNIQDGLYSKVELYSIKWKWSLADCNVSSLRAAVPVLTSLLLPVTCKTMSGAHFHSYSSCIAVLFTGFSVLVALQHSLKNHICK